VWCVAVRAAALPRGGRLTPVPELRGIVGHQQQPAPNPDLRRSRGKTGSRRVRVTDRRHGPQALFVPLSLSLKVSLHPDCVLLHLGPASAKMVAFQQSFALLLGTCVLAAIATEYTISLTLDANANTLGLVPVANPSLVGSSGSDSAPAPPLTGLFPILVLCVASLLNGAPGVNTKH
jgi:hypothetical protein